MVHGKLMQLIVQQQPARTPSSCFSVFLAAARSGVNRYMIALLLQFLVAEKKLEALQVGNAFAVLFARLTSCAL